MTYKIRPKRSNVASKVPLATDLDIGELAINMADQKIYTKTPTNTIVELGGGSGATIDLSAVDQDIVPDGNLTRSLGSPSNQWADLYVGNATIYLNNVPLGLDGNSQLTFNGNVIANSDGAVIVDWADITGKPALFSGSYNDLTSKPTLFTANQSLNTGNSVSFNRVAITGASGIEGGEIELAKAPSSTLAGNVIIDVYENKLRFFEGGGSGRGFYLDLTTGASNTSTNIMSGGGNFSGDYDDLTNKPTLFSGSYTDLTSKPTIPADVSDLTDTTSLLGGGAPGADGASAYELAVDNGFVGNEAAWLASLQGEPGAPGNDGAPGADGNDGAPGAPGADGNDGAPGADGNDGAPGQGVPTGGTTGQVLAKIDGDDYNTEWVNQTGGSSGFDTITVAGSSDVIADGTTTFELVAGTGIAITTGSNNQITISATDSTLLEPYKGFRAHYGTMYNNTDDENGPINKLVIYKSSVTPASAIDTDTSSDDFQVTGLTGSDVVAMLVVVTDGTDWDVQTPTATLKTFVEAIIDEVILDEGVAGDVNTVSAMKSAFYANFSNFNTIIPNPKVDLEFFTVNNQFSISPALATGDGATFSGISYNMSNDTLDLSNWSQGAPNTHEVNDVHVIPGNTIQDADGNYLQTPDNDVTVTITGVSDGAILSYTVTGTLPRPAEIWPTSIDDGGDDEYDGANAIHTNLATDISYNSGNVVNGSSAFGGGNYVVTYQAGIFGIFAVAAAIDIIGTSGDNGGYGNDGSSSGFDGEGIAVTGSLYGDSAPADSPVIATWTSPNSNIWRIETYNGGYSGSYTGGDNDALWFDIENHVSGNSNFRGAVIEYHAFVPGEGTIIGTIHLANDNTQETATHTEHLSGNSDLQFVTLWDSNNSRGRLYFKMTNGNSEDIMIQWTAKIFYGSDAYC